MLSTVRRPWALSSASMRACTSASTSRNAGCEVSTFSSFVDGQVVGQGARQDEVAVGQALHEGACPQAVGPLVREVGLAGDEEPRNGGHQVVIDPEAAHRVVHGRVDSHRRLVGILAGDPLVDLEEVAVLLPDLIQPQPLDGVAEVEIDAVSARPHAAPLVADLLGRARGHVARHQIAEARVAALQVVIALVFGDVVRPPAVSLLLGHPDPAVVAQRFRHQRQLRLVLTRHRNARGVNLRVARVGRKTRRGDRPARWRCSSRPWRWWRGRRRCRSRRWPAPPRRPHTSGSRPCAGCA